MKKTNCKCVVCNKEMYLKPYRIKRVKNGVTCSKKCSYILKESYMKGENNHQFGLIGDKNASFKGAEVLSSTGYILEYCPNHPRPHDKHVKGERVKQHRLVVEKNSHLFNPEYFEEIDGWKILKKEYDVHHKNDIKTDNRVENLEVLTRSAHTTLHNKTKILQRDNLGRIIGVIKDCELLETP